jgi:hypothetical protein
VVAGNIAQHSRKIATMEQADIIRCVQSPLDILVEPRKVLAAVIAGRRWNFAAGMVVLFVCISMASTVVLLHNKGLVSDYLDAMIHTRPNGLSVERLEAARERTRLALQTPGVAILLSVRAGISKLVGLATFWIVLGGAGALAGRSRQAFAAAALLGMGATPVLTLGVTVNILLRLGFHDLNVVASLLPLVTPCGTGSLGCYIVASVDVFSLWYVLVVSVGWSEALRWAMGRTLLLVAVVWAIVTVCSFLTDTGAGWTL